jgi:hypothetical protein
MVDLLQLLAMLLVPVSVLLVCRYLNTRPDDS